MARDGAKNARTTTTATATTTPTITTTHTVAFPTAARPAAAAFPPDYCCCCLWRDNHVDGNRTAMQTTLSIRRRILLHTCDMAVYQEAAFKTLHNVEGNNLDRSTLDSA